jgi:prophage regulatory protein
MTTTKKFLRLLAVIEATGWSRATIWRKVKAGVLPAPISIGPKSIAWDADEIAQWQQNCIDVSRSKRNGPSPIQNAFPTTEHGF